MSSDDERPTPEPPASEASTLRERAERTLSDRAPGSLSPQQPEQIEALLHELYVHQIELELQNDELRRTRDELEASRARYFALYNLAPVGYVTLNAAGLIQEANLTAATLLQTNRNDMVQRPLSTFVAYEDQDTFYHHRRKLRSEGLPQACELQLVRADQSRFWARLESTTAEGQPEGGETSRTVISDITRRMQAEQALRELNAALEQRVHERTAALAEREEHLRLANANLVHALRLKDEFLSMMSHELRTPLHVILGITEALTDGLYGAIAGRQATALASVAQSGKHLLALLSDILDLARMATGRESLDLRPVSVKRLYDGLLKLIEPKALAKQIDLVVEVPPALVGLRADERRLTQILLNLLDNAIKFTPAGGRVGLGCEADTAAGRILLHVWDTGIGIAQEDQARLFEPFTQADARLSRAYGGVGLGLTLVSRLTELHGGTVHLTSAPGQGSRFTVSLPWTAADNLRVRPPEPPAVDLPSWPDAPRVLVIDDHVPTLELYLDLLSQRGCKVQAATSGEQGLALMRAEPPHLLVLDIQMPGLNGLELIARVRAEPATSGLPILVLTALAMPGDRERCLAAGASAYLAKPVGVRPFLTTVAALLPPAGPDPAAA